MVDAAEERGGKAVRAGTKRRNREGRHAVRQGRGAQQVRAVVEADLTGGVADRRRDVGVQRQDAAEQNRVRGHRQRGGRRLRDDDLVGRGSDVHSDRVEWRVGD